jgi:hypothetical protein
MVGKAGSGGGLAACAWWLTAEHGWGSGAEKGVGVSLVSAGWRGERGGSGGVTDLAQGGWLEATIGNGQLGLIGTVAGKAPKLEFGRTPHKAGWGRATRGLDCEVVGVMN